jgi:hypothetical protein
VAIRATTGPIDGGASREPLGAGRADAGALRWEIEHHAATDPSGHARGSCCVMAPAPLRHSEGLNGASFPATVVSSVRFLER